MQQLQPNSTLQGGKYRIEQVLGQGGFGITYLATQTSLQRKVAIKEFFMKDFCSRDSHTMYMQSFTAESAKQVEQYRMKFFKEAGNLARLHHPNIISVIDVFEENGTVYYSMPYYSGGSLQEYVDAHGALSESEAMKLVKQIAKALKYMHEEHHICHFDVKPANIMLDDKGNAILIDFGISKNYDAQGHETSMTPIGLSEGYAPIEQYQQNVEEFSPVSDVYALGATLYFLLHAKRPVSAVHRASGTALLMSKNLSPEIKNVINASMKLIKRERANSVDVFLGVVDNDSESTIIDDGRSDYEEIPYTNKSPADLEREALDYYEKNDIKILNQYGFFEVKKKRQASTIWTSCIVCLILSFLVGMYISASLGLEQFSIGANFIYLFAVILGLYPGLTVGPAILGFNDKRQFNDLADNIKRQFIKDYIKEHSK
jgi:serine/threonine protein kinase